MDSILLPKDWRDRRGVKGARFEVFKDDDGWTLFDRAYATVLSFPTRRVAEETATFARAYVKVWGDIDFGAFPYEITNELKYDCVDELIEFWEKDHPPSKKTKIKGQRSGLATMAKAIVLQVKD